MLGHGLHSLGGMMRSKARSQHARKLPLSLLWILGCSSWPFPLAPLAASLALTPLPPPPPQTHHGHLTDTVLTQSSGPLHHLHHPPHHSPLHHRSIMSIIRNVPSQPAVHMPALSCPAVSASPGRCSSRSKRDKAEEFNALNGNRKLYQ